MSILTFTLGQISSRSSLHWGQRVFTLHVAREGQSYCAHLELSREPKTADLAIRSRAALIHTLPKAERKLWDTANVRDFDIGVQSDAPRSYAIPLAYETIKIASALKALIVFTIYAAEVPRPPQQVVAAEAGHGPAPLNSLVKVLMN